MFMNIADCAKKRFTTKAYDPHKKITSEQVQQIKDVLRFAPSSVNSQPWHFILAKSDSAKARIAKSAEGIHPKNVLNIKQSALVIVFCMKTNINDQYLKELLEQEKQDGRFPNETFELMQKEARKKFTDLHKYDLKDLNHWIEKQIYLNVGGCLLAISTLGLNATPMEGIDPSIIDQEFSLRSKGYMSSLIVTVGHNSEDDFNKDLPKSRLSEDIIFTEI